MGGLARRGAGIAVTGALLAAVLPSAPGVADAQSVAGVPGGAVHHSVVDVSTLPQVQPAEGEERTSPAMPIPHDLAVPPGSAVTSGEPPQPPPSPDPQVPSPPTDASFAALGDNGTSIPPDTMGAVGPSHLMVTLNSQIRIQTKAGLAVSTSTLLSFWSSIPGITDVFDPRVVYDPYGSRWIHVVVAQRKSGASSVLLAVSRTTDPTGLWDRYRIDADATDSYWADYPTLGLNKNWVVVQVNMFFNTCPAPPTSCFKRTQIYAIDRAKLYQASPVESHTLFSDPMFGGQPIGGTQVPAFVFDPTLDTMYLLQTWNGSSGGSGFLRLYTITGPVGSEALAPVTLVSTPNPWDGFPPGGADFAPQLGTSSKIQVNDDRMHSVVYRNGSLWAAHTVFLNAGGSPNRSSVQWWQLTPGGAIQQRSRIDDSDGVSPQNFFGFPSLSVNANGDVLVGYSKYSSSQYASANYSLRRAGDAVNTLRDDAVLKAGEATYFKTFTGTLNRWGDYSHTVVDPTNDLDMWTIQEYAESPANLWGTWWGLFKAPGLVVAQSGGTTAVTEGGAGDTYTVVLNTAPTASVTVSLSVAGGQVTATPSPLTFTTANWSVPQTVTVSAMDDPVDEISPHSDTITHTASSPDADYSGKSSSVVVSVTDNDAAGISVVQSGGATSVSEAGATSDTYTVALSSQPTASVSVALGGSAGQVTLSPPGPLSFTAGNWSSPQIVTVTAVNDAVDEAATHSVTIGHTASSADPFYTGLAGPSVTVSIADDDTAGISIVQSGGTTAVAEAGATSDTYTVVLTSQPTASVSVALAGAAGQVTLAPAGPLTFTAGNWNVPQTVTVTAVNDAIDEAATHIVTITHAATSADPLYSGIPVGSVTVSIADDDTAGVRLTQSGGSTAVTEGGAADTYTVVLDSQPTAPVTVTVTAPAGQMTVSPGSLSFDASNWNVAKTVTVTAIDDTVDEPPTQSQTITHSSSSADLLYNGIPVPSVTVTISDNDPVVVITESGGSTQLDEATTSTDTYTVVLQSAPASPLTITVSPDAQQTASVPSLTFTSSDFSTPQTVTLQAVNDEDDELTPHYGIVTHTASAPDVSARTVFTEITDDDPVRPGSAQISNPAGTTLGVTEAAALRVQCPNQFGPPPSTLQGVDGFVMNIRNHDPFGTLTPTGPNAAQANFDVYFSTSTCARIAWNDFAQAGAGGQEIGVIPSNAVWAVINYVGGQPNASFTFRY